MPEYILNLLPLTEQERSTFESTLPNAAWEYSRRSTVTQEQLSHATIIFGAPKPKELIYATRLNWLQSQWAGVDEYAAPGILADGVLLSCCVGAYDQTVSEHMLTTLLALLRKLPMYRDNQRAHLWRDLGSMRTICGATVLVVGAGHIGTAFARLCRALGAHTVGLKRTVAGSIDGFDQLAPIDELDRWLPQADVVALILPHTPETVGLMNERRLRLMKPDAILLSDGRGSVLDEAALARTLADGHLWGAALDVTSTEPLPDSSPLWDCPNLLLTPHVAGGMRLEVSRANAVQFCLENFKRYLQRQPLVGVVHPGKEIF